MCKKLLYVFRNRRGNIYTIFIVVMCMRENYCRKNLVFKTTKPTLVAVWGPSGAPHTVPSHSQSRRCRSSAPPEQKVTWIKIRKLSEGDLITTMGCLGLLTVQVVLTLFMKLIISEERRGRWAEVTETARNTQRKVSECILQDSSGFSHNILNEKQNGEKEMVKIPTMGHT